MDSIDGEFQFLLFFKIELHGYPTFLLFFNLPFPLINGFDRFLDLTAGNEARLQQFFNDERCGFPVRASRDGNTDVIFPFIEINCNC